MSRLPANVRSSALHWLIPAIVLCLTIGNIGIGGVAVAQNPVPAITLGKTLNAVVGTDASGYTATIESANDIVFDSAGNLYFTGSNSTIRKLSTSGIVTTIAGTGTSGYSGDGGPAINAKLNYPLGIAIDSKGNLYFADWLNQRVRKIAAGTGIVTTVAGNGTEGYSGDGGPAVLAEIDQPTSIAVDNAGDIYIVDVGNFRVRKVTASTGIISNVAGNGAEGDTGDGGPAVDAEISPSGIAIDGAGNLYITNAPTGLAGQNENSVREVNASTGIISTVAGSGLPGYTGDGGPATSAELDHPASLAFDSAGNLYIASAGNNVIRQVNLSTGIISTVAGNGGGGFSTGTATGSALRSPGAIAFDPVGNMYIAAGGHIRTMGAAPETLVMQTMPLGTTARPTIIPLEINATTTISSIAVPVSEGGKQEYKIVDAGCPLNTALQAGKVCDVAVAFIPLYPGERPAPLVATTSVGTFHFGMEGLGTGPQVALTPGTVTTVAGNGNKGFSGNGGPATDAEFYAPGPLALDSAGNLYISDNGNGQVRKVDAVTGIVTDAVGSLLSSPEGIALDAAGNLYIAEEFASEIIEVSADTGKITIIAGNGTSGFSGDGGPATSAELNHPMGVAVDAAGNLYIADSGNNRVREVAVGTGIITTIAGNGTQGYTGDGGPATKAELYGPASLALDSSGDIYFTDAFLTNAAGADVRKIDAATGIITTIAGTGNPGYSGDGGPATEAELNGPFGIALDSAGDLYIADDGNHVIREVSAATGTIRTIAGNGALGSSGDGGAANKAEMIPFSVALDSAGNIYFSNSQQGDGSYNTVRKIDVTTGRLDFADTSVGKTSADSPQIGTISDIGNGTANTYDGTLNPGSDLGLGPNGELQVLPPKSGFNPSISGKDFKLQNGGTCPQLDPSSQYAPLNPGEFCTLQLSFTPTVVGLDTGTVTIDDNAPGSPHIFLLSGTGTGSGTGGGTGTGGGGGTGTGKAGDFTLTAAPSNETVSSGSTATYTVTAAGTNGFTGIVALTATGLPTGMTLDFSHTDLTVSGTPANSTLTIATTANKAQIAPGIALPGGGGPASSKLLRYGLLLLPLPLFGVVRLRKRLRALRRTSVLTVLIVLLGLGALAAGLSGCANIGLEPTTETYNLTVTGVSGNLQHSVPLTLTVTTYKEIKY